MVAEVGAGRKRLQGETKTIPSTPSTVCESTCSMVTPSTSFGPASSVWSQSSGAKTPQKSPASTTSSSSTELDEGSTQLEPKAGDQVDASSSTVVEDNGNHIEKQGWGGSAASYAAGSPGSSHSQSRGAKRLREQTHLSPQLYHAVDGSNTRPSTVSDEHRQTRSGDVWNPRRKECLQQSQYPRLDGHQSPGARPRSHRNQLSNPGLEGESMPCVRGSAPTAMFNTSVGSPASFYGEKCGHENNERTEVGVGVAENGNDGAERDSMGIGSPQDAMDTCGALAQKGSFYPTDQSDGDEMDFDGAEHEPLAHNIGHGGGSHEPLPAATGGDCDRQPNELQSSDKTVVAGAKGNEASALRDAGVTGDEEFRDLFPKLKKLKWKWGGPVTKLGNEYWIFKGGVNSKTATVGVDKFAKEEDVLRYVRGVLALGDATLDNQVRQSGEKRDQDVNGDAEDENGDGDNRDNETQGNREKTKNAAEQRGPLVSMPKMQALQAALEALNPSNAPAVLQQRMAEFNQALRFVTNCVARASGGSLYLCGVPGTGKTQTMAHVQAKVQELYAKGKTPTPAFHAFTGTEFTTPEAMHGALWLAVTGEKDIDEGINVEKKLSAKLKYRQKAPTVTSPMLVVVLDEIDQLMTQNRHVLRKLFEWADAPKSRLVLVGLANSLEFDINLSGLQKAPRRLLFQSYTPTDLTSILTERVGVTVHHSAIQFCAKKAAATTGDARRAINMCREAVVLAEQELQDELDNAASEEEREQLEQGDGSNIVTIRHMVKAVAAGNAAKYAGAIAGLSFYAKVVLAVAAAAVGGVSDRWHEVGKTNGKCARLTQGDLQEKCICAWRRLKTGGGPSQVEFTGIIDLLAASGLLALKSKQQTGGRARELVLRIEFADLEAALGDQPFFKTVTEI
eukprot:g4031.t1